MSAPRSTHLDTALVVLTILGGAVWMALPLSLALDRSAHHLRDEDILGFAVIAGAALGAAAAVTAVPRLSPFTAAVGGALAAFAYLGLLRLGENDLSPFTRSEALTAGASTAAALIAAGLMRLRTWTPRPLLTAGLVVLGATSVAWLAGGVAVELFPDAWPLVIVTIFGGPMVGGIVTAWLVRDASPADVAVAWPLLVAAGTIAVAIATRDPVTFGPGMMTELIAVPFLSGLGAFGSWLVVRRRAPTTDDLPLARALR